MLLVRGYMLLRNGFRDPSRLHITLILRCKMVQLINRISTCGYATFYCVILTLRERDHLENPGVEGVDKIKMALQEVVWGHGLD
jgi:hypothetical protein